jgi:fucose 4-O-acetylase-like acetyltransferase
MGENPTVNSRPAGRINSVDTVKGVAIVLMVFGHTAQGGLHRHLWDAQPGMVRGLYFAESFIYSFHMAAFFFVSGLFIAGSVARRGAPGFTLEKIRTLLYPYILWGVAFALLNPLTARFRMSAQAFSWRSFFWDLSSGNSSWFLITLFVCQLLALVLLLVRLPYWLQMAVALAGCFFVPASDVAVLFQPFLYLPFVIAGSWFSGSRMQMLERLPGRYAWIGFVLLLALQLAMINAWGQVTRWNKVPIGLAGTLMLLLMSQAIRGSATDNALRWYGEGSLAVFVLSPFFQGVGREFVTRVLHTSNPWAYLGFTTIFAATIPAALWFAQDRLHIGWLFRWPAPKKHNVVVEAQSATR